MTEDIRKRYLITLILYASQVSVSSGEGKPSSWNDFWSASCEVSGFASRFRRSMPEGPSLKDPNEFFNYLYPMADLKLKDLFQGEKRSSSPLLISTWIDDLIGLWQSQCNARHRRAKRWSHRKTDEVQEEDGNDRDSDPDDMGDPAEGTNSTSTGSDPAAKKEKVVVADADRFFSQYGGDIEYFFPLIQFGIPFDGEITFLGFQGFKGLWPY